MTPERIHPRRRDRSMDPDWIRAFLRRAAAGVFVTVRDGNPFPIPLNFVYDGGREAIYLHTGRRGRSRGNVEGGPAGSGEASEGVPAALCVYDIGRFLPADEALEFGVEYSSVVVFGRGVVVEDPEEAEAALNLIMAKYAPHLEPGKDYRPVVPEEVRRTTVLRLDIERWSGKEKARDPEYPGAYFLEDVL